MRLRALVSGTKRQTGFTLVELVLTILVMGVLAGGSIAYIVNTTQSYTKTASRNQLSALARIATVKIDRAVSQIAPNTLRIKSSASKDEQCFEYLPVVSSGYYTDAPFAAPGGTNISLIHLATTTGGSYALISPMAWADVYGAGSRTPIASVATATSNAITLTADHIFTNESPGKRVYYADSPVSYCLTGGQLFRYQHLTSAGSNYTLRASQCLPSEANCLPSEPPDRALIVDNIDNSDASVLAEDGSALEAFVYESALASAGLFLLNLNFMDNSESLLINHEIQIKNAQ